MKRKKHLILALVLGTAIFSSCAAPAAKSDPAARNVVPIESPRSEATPNPEPICRTCDVDLTGYAGELTSVEIRGLLLALNDEYLAYATYDRINREFGDPRPFSNIQKAEGRHIERLKSIFKQYGVPVPDNEWIGKVEKFGSVKEACRSGIAGEIANRDLYTRLFESTERQDIITVYKALQSASEENHLPAFERCIGNGNRSDDPESARNRRSQNRH